MFVWSLSSHSRIFHSYGDVTIAGEGLQILTYARQSWPFSSEGSLTCHTHCDTGLPFIMVISEDPWHSHLLPSVLQWSCHYLFLRLWSIYFLRKFIIKLFCNYSLSFFIVKPYFKLWYIQHIMLNHPVHISFNNSKDTLSAQDPVFQKMVDSHQVLTLC